MHTVAVSVWPVAVTVNPELPRPIALPPVYENLFDSCEMLRVQLTAETGVND